MRGAGVDLGAVGFGHVEDVGHAIALGVDLGDRDRQPELVQRVGEREEKPGAVARQDLDHGVARRGAVVDGHLGA